MDFTKNFSDDYIIKEYKEAAEKAIKRYKIMIKEFEKQLKEIEEIKYAFDDQDRLVEVDSSKGSKAN